MWFSDVILCFESDQKTFTMFLLKINSCNDQTADEIFNILPLTTLF